MKPKVKDTKKAGHIKAECPKLKKTEFRKKDNSKKFKRYKKKAMAVAWSNDSDSDSESSSSEEEEEKANLTFMANLEEKELFVAVKTKLCGDKAVDVADLEKNGMHSVVAAMQRMKWTKIVTISKASYPDLVKAFYTCLKSEADGSLTSTVKDIPIHITYDMLESLFGVSTSGCSGVDSVEIHVKGLGIIGTEYKLKDEVIIERMKFATAMIWDKKNKLNVSLPYAHLLTRIFQHYNIDLSGEVLEKMGQAIRSRNLKKSGFSLVAGVWTKTLVAEAEAIIGEAQEVPVPEAEAEEKVRTGDPIAEAPVAPTVLEEAAVAVRSEEPVASPRRIEEIPSEHIEPVGKSLEVNTPTTVITYILHEVLDTVASIQGERVEVVPEVVAPGHSDVQVEDALAQGEHVAEMSSAVKELSMVKAALRWMKTELGSMKTLVTDLSDVVRAHLASIAPRAPTHAVPKSSRPSGLVSVEKVRPPGPRNEEEIQPSGTSNAEEEVWPIGVEDSGPSWPKAGPPGPVVDESGSSGPVESQDEHGRVEAPIEEAVPPEPPTSPLQTPAPPSPPSSTTSPPAPATFKQPLPKNISSPTPFPTTTSSSPISSTFIPPPPSDSLVGASSYGPSSARPSIPPPSTSYSFLHPPTPPSFVTIIPEGAQLEGPFIQGIKDEFEVAILRSVLYLNNLPEVQLGHFRQAISLLSSDAAHFTSIQVDFATLEIPDVVFLPPLHSLVMESTVGPLIFERFARVMGCISVQKENSLAFHRFVYREYHQGHLKSNVLTPLLSECERLSPSDWERHYPLTAQQLLDLNAS
ncbi:hypothetical protein Taro_054086 [Colocasia esculenta]|uniref:Uncharacterized protein n=1 Tax=Colocasia esculenta TaxID=4460 RepID=A0A843XQ13_COLES|nr:hypothetical protein [Colocasia esculenta]